MKQSFDPVEYGKRFRAALKKRGKSVRAAAVEIGISPATVSRIARGKPPNVDGFHRINEWLRAS